MSSKSSKGLDKVKSISRPLDEYNKNNTDGVWRLLHIIAEDATDEEGMLGYQRIFKNLCQKFHGCDCENHCTEMLTNNPIPSWFYDKNGDPVVDDTGKPVGCLNHSFHCHNLVNQRLGKVTYSFEELRSLYRKPAEPCTRENDNNYTETSTNLFAGSGINESGSSYSISDIYNRNQSLHYNNNAEKVFRLSDLESKYPYLFVKPSKQHNKEEYNSKESKESKENMKKTSYQREKLVNHYNGRYSKKSK
jgi:hypothetical protein